MQSNATSANDRDLPKLNRRTFIAASSLAALPFTATQASTKHTDPMISLVGEWKENYTNHLNNLFNDNEEALWEKSFASYEKVMNTVAESPEGIALQLECLIVEESGEFLEQIHITLINNAIKAARNLPT